MIYEFLSGLFLAPVITFREPGWLMAIRLLCEAWLQIIVFL
jgi:hypothetical protein